MSELFPRRRSVRSDERALTSRASRRRCLTSHTTRCDASRTRCLEVNLKEIAKKSLAPKSRSARNVYIEADVWCTTCKKALDAPAGWTGDHCASKGSYHVTSIHSDCSCERFAPGTRKCVDRRRTAPREQAARSSYYRNRERRRALRRDRVHSEVRRPTGSDRCRDRDFRRDDRSIGGHKPGPA